MNLVGLDGMPHCATCTCEQHARLQRLLELVALEPGLTTRQLQRRLAWPYSERMLQILLARAAAGGQLRSIAVSTGRSRRYYHFPPVDVNHVPVRGHPRPPARGATSSAFPSS